MAKVIRNMENEERKYKNNIICITKDNKMNYDPKIYNDYCKKIFYLILLFFLVEIPIKNSDKLSSIIKNHFLLNRTDININHQI